MKKLLELRKAKNLTQQQVADMLEVSRQAYANYETGNRRPDPDTLKRLATIYDVSIDYILEIQEKPASDDDELNAFLFSLGCYSGEAITVVRHLKGGCIVAIKDGRYNIDNQLAEAIII